MPKDKSPGKPTARRYSPEEKAQAVRLVRQLRAELGTEHGTIQGEAHLTARWDRGAPHLHHIFWSFSGLRPLTLSRISSFAKTTKRHSSSI
jgi:hypothetical protein